MAKKKADLIEEAKALGLEVSEKMTIAQINEAIAGASEAPKAEAKTEEPTAEAADSEEENAAE